MSTPNFPGGDLPELSINGFGLGAFSQMTEADWKDYLDAKWRAKYNPIGDVFGAIRELVNAVVAVFQGDYGPLEELIGETIEGIRASFEELFDAMKGEYAGDNSVLLAIQALFAPLRKLIEVVGGVAAGLIPSASQVATGWASMSTMVNQIADIFNGLVVTPINSAVAGVLDWFTGLLGWKSTTTANVSANATAVSSASAAALAANNKVDALITGGVRTIYTSSTTWTKPVGAVKIGVVCIGAGGGGQDAQRLDSGSRAFGGGYAYSEFPADALPSTVALTVPLGRAHNILGPGVASFGTYLESPVNGSGFIKTYSGRTAVLNAPGHPGALCEETGPAGSAGPLGGSPTTGTSTAPAGAGENGDTTGIDITGAGGGGGGNSEASGAFGGATSEGGPGGFPGGPGGQGGTTGLGTARNGGAGGGALVAVIVW
ncbi:hypothetical protein GYA93_15745 [Gordonia desulfuricans]|uniref:Minor tail protein n=1 Tax=Gordonia desulfuricans TaxID=89051 RepID=A0A7K3LRY0_9ACTN|nr:hypothetical protein [Gordonia desulfuricans]NDK91025.1 hypothetical protein [Gordonia desulfuricans]